MVDPPMKMNKLLPLSMCMNLTNTMLNKRSQTQKYILGDPIFIMFKKNGHKSTGTFKGHT